MTSAALLYRRRRRREETNHQPDAILNARLEEELIHLSTHSRFGNPELGHDGLVSKPPSNQICHPPLLGSRLELARHRLRAGGIDGQWW